MFTGAPRKSDGASLDKQKTFGVSVYQPKVFFSRVMPRRLEFILRNRMPRVKFNRFVFSPFFRFSDFSRNCKNWQKSIFYGFCIMTTTTTTTTRRLVESLIEQYKFQILQECDSLVMGGVYTLICHTITPSQKRDDQR